jgi:hypothetical protein
MWQMPCKMTNSSSKPLQPPGKWYQPRNQKKNKTDHKNPESISHPQVLPQTSTTKLFITM